RSALDNAAFLALAERNVRAVVARSEFAAEQWKGFAARLDYLAMDASQSADFGRLARHLKSSEGRVLVHYLATSPSLFAPIAQNLSIAGLAGPQARIVLEKPLGHSLDS
ncbi:glucose-6-phosphate dehydrogenase, partial [Pseudomonas aeruginosa]|nr:glucose-6-phosphate dehydrogenase [Pseudomonas aeruginosa]